MTVPSNVSTADNRKMQRLVWRCERCGKPIGDGAGYVAMSFAELHAYKRALEAWNERVDRDYPGAFRCYPVSELLDYPEPVRWHVLHGLCDPEPDSPDYWIGVERIRTAAAVISWSSHLIRKNWIHETDDCLPPWTGGSTWNAVLDEAARQLGGSLS